MSGELITGRRQLLEGMAFTPGSTVIVDQGEKLSLKQSWRQKKRRPDRRCPFI
ncbi:hypothetical protein N7A96_004515 [Escherichia coli]|nr:hypothetical protein [Escherichia coli]EKR8900492.1 hypothetical protein [Escherichia coli]